MVTTSGTDSLAPLRRAIAAAAPSLSRNLPWSNHAQPWAIFVAEIMLQQTSVARVLEPWRNFLEIFPSPTACADAPQSEVLRQWSGLGYPRRARNLHRAALAMRDHHDGNVPRTLAELLELPGVGNYTAHAVASFAFAAPVGVLDTNSGRVLARCVVGRRLTTSEAQAQINALVDPRHSARFNQAVLDLGAQFCRSVPLCENCPVRQHCHWQAVGGEDPATKSAGVSRSQSPFAGSDRQVRGRLLKELISGTKNTSALLSSLRDIDAERIERLLRSLVADGLVSQRGRKYTLADN
jgi:A/G-specific adenine glycosylase